MSLFLCTRCGDIRDSDDGCAEAPSPPWPKHSLLCYVCEDEVAEEKSSPAGTFSAEQQRIIDQHMADADKEGP